MQTLELLAPAKNLECGISAVDHGADAVYIGPAHHGARAAAGNSIEDIRSLCEYAHRFAVKVHATVNTIVYDDEMDDTLQLVEQLVDAGVDALLVQDIGLLSRLTDDSPLAQKLRDDRISLHASTQCDTRTAEKVSWLHHQGFNRVVLARELSVEEIAAIHQAVPDVELEAFVHGALCVSYSGVCYASQYCFQRSANRGACAQFCRMTFDLIDADNKVIEHDRHLLSLKDMCQLDNLEALAQSGVCAFKIEGRLKDADYVKNVVSAYSQKLDALVARHPELYRRASAGRVEYHFNPDLKKTFNRGYTTYFLHGRQPDIASFDTPKALGEYVGHVKEIRRDSFNVAGTASFSNGDGLCFITDSHHLEGFRVNRAVGNRLYPYKMPANLRPGLALYRNNDVAFEKILQGKTAERHITVDISFGLTAKGFFMCMSSAQASYPCEAKSTVDFEHQPAKRPQGENIRRQLSKLGDTPYSCNEFQLEEEADNFFVPNSLLSDLRRKCTETFSRKWKEAYLSSRPLPLPREQSHAAVWQPEYASYPYLYNIANYDARAFYRSEGMAHPADAFEMDRRASSRQPLVMQCRHCIRYALGYCVKHGGQRPTWHEPLTLRLGDGRRFRLEFKCNECQMNIYAE
ncbi:MAG: peptidase U32 family protein [Prevotella sp.]|jgi:putative protease